MDNTKYKLVWLILITLLLSACDYLPVKNDLPGQISQQMALGDFDKAVELVNTSNLPETEKKKYIKEITKQRQQFQNDFQQARRKIEKQIKEDRWQAAQQELEKIRTKYPKNRELLKLKKEIHTRHMTRKLVLRAQILVGKIEQTQKNKKIYIQRARVENKSPEDFYYEQTLQGYARQLSAIALNLAHRDELIYAKQYSLVALNAHRSDYTQKKHNEILAIVEQRREVLLQTLEQDYKLALKRGALNEAREILKKMLFLAPDNKDYLALKKQLQWRINNHVEALLQQGRVQYAAGNIEQAIQTWEQGLSLAPNHKELRRSLNHAYKARATLNRIRKQQSQ
jgi:tetratricopeptide (TPR) repeat protein